MEILEIFPSERIQLDLSVANREDLFRYFARRMAELGLADQDTCLEALSEREALGSTALGHGVAIPHARIEGLSQAIGMCVVLEKPIDLEAADHEPVDVVFMLLMPARSASEQMKVLSVVARTARQEPVINALRRAETAEDVLEILKDAQA